MKAVSSLKHRIRRYSETRQRVTLLRDSPLYDDGFYASVLGVRPAKRNISHYLQTGWKLGLNPSQYFNTLFYLQSYPDVQEAGLNPLVHYLLYGWKEFRWPHPKFDPGLYRHVFCLSGSIKSDPLTHAILHNSGWLRLRLNDGDAQIRILTTKQIEALITSGYFDANFYRTTYPDIHPNSPDSILAAHYLQQGWREDRNPGPEFYTNFYIRSFPEALVNRSSPIEFHLKVGAPRHYPTRFGDAVTLPVTEHMNACDFNGLKVAIHLHAFYMDIFEELVRVLQAAPIDFHLLVTVVTTADKIFAENILRRTTFVKSFEVAVVPRQGRDLGPLLITARKLWFSYDLICHIHTKKVFTQTSVILGDAICSINSLGMQTFAKDYL